MDGSRRIVDLDGITESHYWTPSDDILPLDESSCGTVVTDSVDSDFTPSPFILRGLQFLKRAELGRQSESEHSVHCTESDDSQSTNCSEFILDPSKRLKGLSLKETDTAHTSTQHSTHDAGNKSPIISVTSHPPSDLQHQSPLPKIHQISGREGQVEEKSCLMVTGNLLGIAKDHLASCSRDVLSLDLSSGQERSPIKRNICRQTDGSGSRKNSTAARGVDDISLPPCIADVPIGGPLYSTIDSKDQISRRANDSFEHQSTPSPEKMRKLSDGSGFYLSDSLEDVTQVDGSACMFSDSSPGKSPSDHLLLPQSHRNATGYSEEKICRMEQQHSESKVATTDYQMTCESDDMPFNECQNINCLRTESYRSVCQLHRETSPVTQFSQSADVSGSSTAQSNHEAGTEDDFKRHESIISVQVERMEMRNSQDDVNDAVVTSPDPDRISIIGRMEAKQSQEKSNTGSGHGDEEARDVERSMNECLRSSKRNTISEAMTKAAKGQGRSGYKFGKRGKGRKRSLQTMNERGKCSPIDRSQDDVMTRSQRQNAGIHRSDILIHERVLVLQERLTKVKSSQNTLTKSLFKPKNVIADAAKVGQQLRSIQTNLRQIASDLKEAKTDLERSLFDLRFVYSQKKRKAYVQQELNSVLEIQQSLWTRLRAHREIASRLQNIIRMHTKEMKETRRKQTKHTTEKTREKQESVRPPSSDGSSGSSCDNVTKASSESTTKESIAEERQKILLQQLLETLDECKGNLLVKFMSMLQGNGTDQQKDSLDLKKTLPATSSIGVLGEESRRGMKKSVSLASALGNKGVLADSKYVRKLGEIEEAEAGEISRGGHDLTESSPHLKEDRSRSHSKIIPGLDMGHKELVLNEYSSSGDSAEGQFTSSSDDEMSVVPEPSDKLRESLSFEERKTKGTVGKIDQVTPIGQVVSEVLHVSEDVNSSLTNAQLSTSINNCASTSAVGLESLCYIKTVDNCSSLNGPSTRRDVLEQQPEQMPCIPDMKLYNKIHLMNENELMPYTEVLPNEMWSTDDISSVGMPREFFDKIDSW